MDLLTQGAFDCDNDIWQLICELTVKLSKLAISSCIVIRETVPTSFSNPAVWLATTTLEYTMIGVYPKPSSDNLCSLSSIVESPDGGGQEVVENQRPTREFSVPCQWYGYIAYGIHWQVSINGTGPTAYTAIVFVVPRSNPGQHTSPAPLAWDAILLGRSVDG